MYEVSFYPIAPNLWRWEIRSGGALLLCGTAPSRVAAENDANAGLSHFLHIPNLEIPRLARIRKRFRFPIRKLVLQPFDFAWRNRFVQQRIVEPRRPARVHRAARDAQIWCDEDSRMLP